MPFSAELPGGVAIPRWKWTVVWLLFLATMINYMDRQTMQAASTHLIREFFDGKEAGYGEVESRFKYAFACGMIVAGFLVDRFNVRWFYLGALLVWSAAGVATGLVRTLDALIACRMVLGVAEAFNWPCAVSVVRRVLPLEARSLANGVFHSGASIGAAATPILAWLIIGPSGEHWRSLFLIVGLTGIGWAAAWLWVVRGERAREIEAEPSAAPPLQPDDAVPSKFAEELDPPRHPPLWRVLLTDLFWIALSVSITVNVCWHFFRAWLPRILKKDLNYGEHEMLWMMAGFFVAADIGCLVAGYVTRRLTAAGLSVERSRKWVTLGTALVCLLAIPAMLLPVGWWTVPLILVVASGAMGGFANMFSLAQETSPPHTATIVGIVSAAPWFLLAALDPVIGRLADQSGTFVPTVVGMACVPIVGAAIGWFWPEPRGEKPVAGAC